MTIIITIIIDVVEVSIVSIITAVIAIFIFSVIVFKVHILLQLLLFFITAVVSWCLLILHESREASIFHTDLALGVGCQSFLV